MTDNFYWTTDKHGRLQATYHGTVTSVMCRCVFTFEHPHRKTALRWFKTHEAKR